MRTYVLVVVGFLALLMPKKLLRSSNADAVSKFEAGVSKVYDGDILMPLDVVTEMDYFIGSYCGWDHIS